MRPSLRNLAFVAALALLVTATSGVQAQTPTELPPLGGDTESSALWINDRGYVAGNSFAGDGTVTAVVWDENGTPTPLPPLSGDTESRVDGSNVINNKGEIVGTSFDPNRQTNSRGVVWNHNGTILRVLQPVDPVGSDVSTLGSAISANGRVAGESRTDIFGVSGVVWDQKGNPSVIIDVLGCVFAGVGNYELNAINARGEVTGPCNGGLPQPGEVWDRKGQVSSLPPLPGFDRSEGLSINARGDVVGFSEDSQSGTATSTVWDHKRSPRRLPPLPGDVNSFTSGINDQGEVVGSSIDSSGNVTAVVWNRAGNATALPPLAGDADSFARGISRRSVVVGTSRDSSGNRTAVVWR